MGGNTIHYTIGTYLDGTVGELFIDASKYGAALREWMGQSAMTLSIALQHRVPLDTYVDLFVGTRSDPSGPVEGHDRITTCTSVMDLIARDLGITFLGREDLADRPPSGLVPPVPRSSKLPPFDANEVDYENGQPGGRTDKEGPFPDAVVGPQGISGDELARWEGEGGRGNEHEKPPPEGVGSGDGGGRA